MYLTDENTEGDFRGTAQLTIPLRTFTTIKTARNLKQPEKKQTGGPLARVTPGRT